MLLKIYLQFSLITYQNKQTQKHIHQTKNIVYND